MRWNDCKIALITAFNQKFVASERFYSWKFIRWKPLIISTKTRPQKVLITTGEQLKIRNPRETPVDVKAITNFALPKGRSSDWCWLSIYLFVYRVDRSCVRNIKPRCKVNVSSWGEPLHIDFLRQISFWQTGLIFG